MKSSRRSSAASSSAKSQRRTGTWCDTPLGRSRGSRARTDNPAIAAVSPSATRIRVSSSSPMATLSSIAQFVATRGSTATASPPSPLTPTRIRTARPLSVVILGLETTSGPWSIKTGSLKESEMCLGKAIRAEGPRGVHASDSRSRGAIRMKRASINTCGAVGSGSTSESRTGSRTAGAAVDVHAPTRHKRAKRTMHRFSTPRLIVANFSRAWREATVHGPSTPRRALTERYTATG